MQTPSEFEQTYLETDDPRAQSGFHGSAERLEAVLKFGNRTIVSSEGSFRRPDSPRAEPIAKRLGELGYSPAGERYSRSEEHEVEIAIAWIDAG